VTTELAVISGKGGTGKTSLTASFAVLADRPILADCDVDAPDLHLLLAPEVRRSHAFRGGAKATVDPGRCSGCGTCSMLCRFDGPREILTGQDAGAYGIDPFACEGCGVCARFCPENAITLEDRVGGTWAVSDTRRGPMVHARLRPGAENSGRLVSIIRREAQDLARVGDRSLILIDGPPGVGCPLIASVTGATLVLLVTEPTISGRHDLWRALSLANHFAIPAAVCVNKWDLNPQITEQIEREAERRGAHLAGRVRYDPAVTLAQIHTRTIVEDGGPAAEDVHRTWARLQAWGSIAAENR
jgi:MinD superfamily P-loop ATPase